MSDPTDDDRPENDERPATEASPENDERPTEETPATGELEEPSTEKDPGEEPKGGDAKPEPSHEAVGIGVVGRPQVGAEEEDLQA